MVILFIGSGCAALVYEIVWLQMLGLVVGGSAISLGVLLGTFMGGMCLGSLLLPKLISKRIHPLLLYGLLELFIGVIGLAELWLVPTMSDLYTHFAHPGASAVALRAFFAGICLLPPTMLMGATLPAIARYVETSPRGVSWLGFFYGGNTLGAVCGCLLASWYLLPNYDTYTATYWAAAINAIVAIIAIILSLMLSYDPGPEPMKLKPAERAGAAPGAWAVYLTLALSGLTGLGSEVVWTRQLSLMLGASVYTFANILAVFLLGLGIGSSVGSFIARAVKEPKVALAWCQLLLAGAIAWAAYAISYSLPFWPIDPRYAISPWFIFQTNLACVFWALFPGAILWGATFPIGLAALARKNQDPGRLVGGAYAANTVGAIFGSLLFAMIVMQNFGSQNAQRILIGLCTMSAFIAVIPVFGKLMSSTVSRSPDEEPGSAAGAVGLGIGMLAALIGACALMVNVGPPNWGAVAWGRNSAGEMPYLFPGVIGKSVPLSGEEKEAIEQACKERWFSELEYDGTQITRYALEEKVSKETVESWLKTHGKALASGLSKRDKLSDPYRAVLQASSLNIRNLRLENGELQMALLNDTERSFALSHKADLQLALQQRFNETGRTSVFAYDENRRPNRYCVYVGEGMNVSVAVTYDDAGYRYFHGAGKVQASSNPADMRLQRSLGHISALTNYAQTGKTPKDVLVVACGAGVTAGSFVPYGSEITIVDIEAMVPRYVTPQFADSNHDVIPPEWSMRPTGYKKTNIIIDDGRHYMRTAKDKKFDVVTSDPIDPWVKGCAALNTIEYYEMCKSKLKPGGIMALWIPFYESSEDTSKSIIATFFKVFPNGIIWSNDQNGAGYDAVLFGSVDMDGKASTLKLDLDKVQAYLDDPANAKIKQSIRDVHFGERNVPGNCEAVELFSMYAGTAPLMENWLRDTDRLINYDRNLKLQYVAGLWINKTEEGVIFNNILRDYTYPRGGNQIFFGKQERITALQEIMAMTGRHDRSPQGAN
jgi:spermidine synthase